MSEFRLLVRPDIEEWGSETDDRWRTDLADLHHELARELPAETSTPEPADGGRGLADFSDVIMTLGSAGAITAAVEVIKSWIGARPGRRKVKVAFDDGGKKRTIVVDSDGLGAQELASVATSALTGDPPAQSSGSEPPAAPPGQGAGTG